MVATIRILWLRPKRRPANFVPFSSFSSSDQEPSKCDSSDEIRKKLAEFRSRFTPPPRPPTGGDRSPSPPSLPSKYISFQELYRQNVASKGEEFSPDPAKPATGKPSLDAVFKSLPALRKKNPGIALGKTNDPLSLSNFKDSLRLRPGDLSPKEPPIVTLSDKLRTSMFPKASKDLKDGDNRVAGRKMFVRESSYQELGEKLRSLRPEHKGKKNWFSLQELNDRLIKLREIDDKKSEAWMGGVYKHLKESLVHIGAHSPENRNSMIRKLDVLRYLGENAEYLSHPPKEHLVEKYFDPGNMSSAEKMKLDLKKVRDEFKMSESDCGSARVQVAQLTTKIKHLSGVLHKKDKHSRKGLQAMVQKRKKLLKYLRRTDWDSFCLVLSKLGLRDNPDYKN